MTVHLTAGQWIAPFIATAVPTEARRPAWFRTEFDLSDGVRSAILVATAHGAYQASVNSHDVDDDVLKPGWTSYRWRLLHETTDVTEFVRVGRNALGLRAAGAWYTESAAWGIPGSFYGDNPAVAAQLIVTYNDGRVETIITGEKWRATEDGPTTASGIYDGERVDARRDLGAWDSPSYDDTSWTDVRVVDEAVVPEPRLGAPVRRQESLPVREVITTPSGATVLDFGQNLVGRLRFTVDGPAGTEIVLRHAEVLEHGELGIRPLRDALATDRYVLRDGRQTWEPEFTFHGFRYAQIDGWPGEFDPAAVEAVVLHSDMRRTGWFECSDPRLERLHENVVWSMRGNFLSLPTDCPQRDERLGWTGDIQVFAPTATGIYDCDAFLTSWLRDLWLEQSAANGVVPYIVPDVLDSGTAPRAAWGDAATVVPWTLFERYADTATLAAQYPSMRAWVDAVLAVTRGTLLWEGQPQFGDWLDPQAPPHAPGDARTSADLVASAHLIRSTDLVVRAANVLGRADDERTYGDIAAAARVAFADAYLTPSGRLLSDTPTAYAMALEFDLVSDDLRPAVGRRLAHLVRAAGYRISTGFVGTPIIQDALTSTGHHGVAAKLMLQTANPSWLYPVTMGATTIWERWDSMLEDGSINPGTMTSFNHYALGAVADWLHRVVAGLAPAEPGYRVVRIEPQPLPGIDSAGMRLATPYGESSVSWNRTEDGCLDVIARIPSGATGVVRLPGWPADEQVGPGEHRWTTKPIPSEVRAPIGPEATPAEVVSDAVAYDAVLAAVAAHGEPYLRLLRTRTAWLDNIPLAEEYHRTPAIADDIRAALTRVGTR